MGLLDSRACLSTSLLHGLDKGTAPRTICLQTGSGRSSLLADVDIFKKDSRLKAAEIWKNRRLGDSAFVQKTDMRFLHH